jgi:hypothetical protein
MSQYLEELEAAGMSLMVYKSGEVIFQSASGGVRPHLEAIEELGRAVLRETIMVDKIVGRAAALLILYAGAAEAHAAVISASGKAAFSKHGMKFTYAEEAEHIKTRDGQIYCPFERMVQGIDDPEKAYLKIRAKLAEL